MQNFYAFEIVFGNKLIGTLDLAAEVQGSIPDPSEQ